MKKGLVIFLCLFMLCGCQKVDNTEFYDSTYDTLKKQGVISGLGTANGKIVFYGNGDENMFQWMCVLGDNYETVSILNFKDGYYVYGDEAVKDEKYEEFLKKTTLTQEELNQFSAVFYQKNIDKAKEGVSK